VILPVTDLSHAVSVVAKSNTREHRNVIVKELIASKPSSDWETNNFDLIRLLAALQVAITHAISDMHLHGSFARIMLFGLSLFPGVPIFFVVSGFLISRSYEHSDSARNYFRNRCLRIYPGLWICLLATLGAMLWAGISLVGTFSTREWLLWWAGQMSIFQNFSLGFGWPPGPGGPNASLWTIPIELEFYIVLPAIYAAFRLRKQRGNILLLALLAASAALDLGLIYSQDHISSYAPYSYLPVTVVPFLWMFLVGVLLQRNWNRLRSVLAGRAHWWLLGYLLLCLVATRLRIYVNSNAITPVFLLPLAGLVISGATSAPWLADRILRHQDISYGTYVYHALVINLMVGFGFIGSAFSAATAIGASLVLAVFSWLLVEKPFLRHKRDALRPTTGGSVVTDES
jgi:peptidoglycan/LPS O-acetylase OafA/YrhL